MSTLIVAFPKLEEAKAVRNLLIQIGRARVGKECRSRWSPYH